MILIAYYVAFMIAASLADYLIGLIVELSLVVTRKARHFQHARS